MSRVIRHSLLTGDDLAAIIIRVDFMEDTPIPHVVDNNLVTIFLPIPPVPVPPPRHVCAPFVSLQPPTRREPQPAGGSRDGNLRDRFHGIGREGYCQGQWTGSITRDEKYTSTRV